MMDPLPVPPMLCCAATQAGGSCSPSDTISEPARPATSPFRPRLFLFMRPWSLHVACTGRVWCPPRVEPANPVQATTVRPPTPTSASPCVLVLPSPARKPQASPPINGLVGSGIFMNDQYSKRHADDSTVHARHGGQLVLQAVASTGVGVNARNCRNAGSAQAWLGLAALNQYYSPLP